ncbi:hypothetical protein D3C78_962010 [compost metagenome]
MIDSLEYRVLVVGSDQQADHFFLRIDGDAEQAVPLTGAKPVGVVDNGAWRAHALGRTDHQVCAPDGDNAGDQCNVSKVGNAFSFHPASPVPNN